MMKDNQTTYLANSLTIFNTIKEKILNAKKEILLEFFYAEISIMFCQIIDLLLEKSQHGVKIMLLFDKIGCLFKLPKSYIKALECSGIKIKLFNSLTCSGIIGVDHIKMAIFDRTIAIIAGMNLADKYVNYIETCGHWKESGIMLSGKQVDYISKVFYNDWNCAKTDFEYQKNIDEYGAFFNLKPQTTKNITNKLINQLEKCNDYAIITTPYLVPSFRLQKCLINCVERGAKITIILPSRPDKRGVFALSKIYAKKLKIFGINVLLYDRGFIHQKSFLIDGNVCGVGSLNMDNRSLKHSRECEYFSNEKQVIDRINIDLQNILKCCSPFDGKMSVLENIIGHILLPFNNFI